MKEKPRMSFINRLLGTRPDPREELRPLWHRSVEISRQPHWYAQHGVADTVPGRFDMITAILALVLLRLEQDEGGVTDSTLMTELFVEDMDGQLRETGVGDVVVGKRMGRLVSVLGGRIGAFRTALAQPDNAALEDAVARNVTLNEGASPAGLAAALRLFQGDLASLDYAAVRAGRIGE